LTRVTMILMGGSQLDRWAADVRDGKIPNFGANLRY
jgi:hypothetical protein